MIISVWNDDFIEICFACGSKETCYLFVENDTCLSDSSVNVNVFLIGTNKTYI